MDRLQEAIEKARSIDPSVASLPVPRRALVPVPARRSVADHWASLQPLCPDAKHMRRHRIAIASDALQASPFDVLRTKTLQTMRANGWRRLAITSATKGCGKSMVALNLAFSLSRQPDTRTILFDLDLRHPSLAATLGVSAETCVTSVLAGDVSFADQALCYQGNLALSCCTGFGGDPAEVLLNPHFAQRIAGVESAYDPDVVLFDMPPMPADDAMTAIAAQADCVLLVAAAGQTTAKEIDTCEHEIARQTNFMGVVLNKCRYGTA